MKSNKKTKKFFILICEGKTDEIALRMISNQYFKSLEKNLNIRFEIFGGDFLIKEKTDQTTFSDPQKVEERVIKLATKQFRKMESDGIEIGDILGVATLSDLDGCYIKDDRVIYSEEGIAYDVENSLIETKDVVFLRERNYNKQVAVEILNDLEKIKMNLKSKCSLPFRSFYFNLNMEHVFYDSSENYTGKEKEKLANEFRNKYYGKPIEFIRFIRELPSISNDYKESWNRVTMSKHPLDRYTNISCLYEWVISLVQE